jgi:succinate-semialdehyde dehydrogenase/glutarate-semialdehyde dehydrogenase
MKMLIAGLPADASDGAVSEVTNPATGDVVDTVPAATVADCARALAAARAAQPAWAAVPMHERVATMDRFLALVDRDAEELARTLSAETGKPIVEARAEIGNIPIAFRAFGEKAKHLYGELIPPGIEAGQEHHLQLVVREPVGVVVAIIPFNFPCDLFDQKVAPALLAGNAVVVKPSSDNPLTLCRLTHLLAEAGVTPGAVSIVTGSGTVVGSALTGDPDVDLVTLTGSTEVGIATAQAAAPFLTHVALELGGNDAFLVLADADLDLAADEVVWARMYNGGQVCCASKRFLVHASVADEFAAKVVERLERIHVGDPADESSQMGCMVSEKAATTIEKQVELTREQGGTIVLGGTRKGAYYYPTVITGVPASADVATDMEIFGPVVPIIRFDTVDEAVEIANSSKFGLAGCVFSRDFRAAYQVASRLDCGSVVVNGGSFFRSFEMPFGGYKYSGMGTEGVSSTFDEMTRVKTVVLKNVV